jgi:hypothetical protein
MIIKSAGAQLRRRVLCISSCHFLPYRRVTRKSKPSPEQGGRSAPSPALRRSPFLILIGRFITLDGMKIKSVTPMARLRPDAWSGPVRAQVEPVDQLGQDGDVAVVPVGEPIGEAISDGLGGHRQVLLPGDGEILREHVTARKPRSAHKHLRSAEAADSGRERSVTSRWRHNRASNAGRTRQMGVFKSCYE